MKRFFQISLIAVLLVCETVCIAQNVYKPRDKWPYIYESFSPAIIHQTNNLGDIEATANICVDDGSLHYIEDGVILQATNSTISKVDINGKTFVSVYNQLMESVASSPDGYIVKKIKVTEETQGANLGYGMTSSNFSARNVDLTASTAFGVSLLHSKLAEASENAEYGTPLTIEEELCFFVNGRLISASKKDFTEAVGKDKANAFLKANKIKWNEPASIIPVISFIKANN